MAKKTSTPAPDAYAKPPAVAFVCDARTWFYVPGDDNALSVDVEQAERNEVPITAHSAEGTLPLTLDEAFHLGHALLAAVDIARKPL